MKPGLAVLPMDVWADVFVFPWMSRKQLAKIVHKFKERAFAEKLQTLLHDPKCGKHSLRLYFNISFKQALKLRNQKIPECQASLTVSPQGMRSSYKECGFPEAEIPENITKFKQLSIGFLDDRVIDFLDKIKPVFTNVFLDICSLKSAPALRILFAHLLPMLVSVRKIACNHTGFEILATDYPGTLALAKELDLPAKIASIPAYMNLLKAPAVHGPRFLKVSAGSKAIFAIVEAIHQQFLTATTQSTFVIFFEFNSDQRHLRTKELTLQNAATNEQLAIRNAHFNKPWLFGNQIHYVEVLRHQIEADTYIREWIKKRAYYENKYNYNYQVRDKAEQVISVTGPSLNIGQITKESEAKDQAENEDQQLTDEEEEAGPSTSAKRMKLE